MARREYGGGLADFTSNAAGLLVGGLDVYAWDARTGGSRISDILALSGTTTADGGGTHLVTATGGAISLLGPDGYDDDGLWVSADPSPTAPRLWLRALHLSGGGPGTDTRFEWTQATPAATWSIPHPFGRRPVATVYVAGEVVDADVTATAVNLTVTFPAPTAGTVALA